MITTTDSTTLAPRAEIGWTRRAPADVEQAGRGVPAPAWDGGQGWVSTARTPVALIDVREHDSYNPEMVLVMKLVITVMMLAVSAMAGAWVGQLN